MSAARDVGGPMAAIEGDDACIGGETPGCRGAANADVPNGVESPSMAVSIVVLHVRNNARADAILDGLADRLGIRYFRPDASGRAELRRQLNDRDAYVEITGALDATADDWRDHITVLQLSQYRADSAFSARPSSTGTGADVRGVS